MTACLPVGMGPELFIQGEYRGLRPQTDASTAAEAFTCIIGVLIAVDLPVNKRWAVEARWTGLRI